jgi:hypothetical protein
MISFMHGRIARLFLVGALALTVVACGKRKNEGDVDSGTGQVDGPPCTELGCFIADCAIKNLPPTTITGTVYAPNGTLPLYGVNVYIPASDPGPLPDGAVCDRCANGLPGGSWVSTTTDEAGRFQLVDVPATDNVPLVIQSGKWRKQLTLPTVAACQDFPLSTAQTSLPKNKSEGDMPKIAITTGNADALDCLPRKLGIDDSEITTNGGTGRVQLFNGNGANKFAATHPTGAMDMAAATTLWSDVNKLKEYDIVILSCEGAQNAATKPQPTLDAMKAYADLGGRVFASHWHNIWVSGHWQGTGDGQKPAVWGGTTIASGGVADWQNDGTLGSPDLVDEAAHAKGPNFAKWLENVGASPPNMRGVIPTTEGKRTAIALDNTKAERWVYYDGTVEYPQIFQFTTPLEAPKQDRCGKVVFSDMHVSSGSTSKAATPYPGTQGAGCSTNPLTPQEKALAFIFFDLASCVGVIK